MAAPSRESLGANVSAGSAGTGTDSMLNPNLGSLRAGLDSDTSINSENLKVRMSNLKYSLETWREVLIHLYAVLIWKRPFYPLVLWAVISSFFAIVYYAELTALTTLAILSIFAVLSDYLVPLMQTQFFDPALWTGVKEKKYEEVCMGIACAQERMSGLLHTLNSLKRNRPSAYFLIVLMGLLAVAWIGSLMDNLLLTYIFVCTGMMVPGLIHRGYLHKYFGCASSKKKKKN